MKTAIVLGASGLVGKQLTARLLEAPQYTKVIILVRKHMNWKHAKLQEVIFDFSHPDAQAIMGDDLFCCLGTTAKAAGSQAAQQEVDYRFPFEIGKIAAKNGVKQYILVSSIGADPNTSNFYLKLKGELERDLADLPFVSMIAVRPSLLLGERSDVRFGEMVGIFFMQIFGGLMVGPLKKYRGIESQQVARAMVALAQEGRTGYVVVNSDVLQDTV
jgi:uncharacterized protein YbjT (DUF2867 family)